MSNKKATLIMIIMFISGLLLGYGLSILIPQKDKEKKEENNKEEIKDYFKDITDSLDKVSINGQKVNFNYKTHESDVGDVQDLYIDNTLLVKTDILGAGIDSIYQTWDNYFIIFVGHEDIRKNHIYSFDSKGNLISDINDVDKNMVITMNGFRLDDSFLQDNNIIAETTRYIYDAESIVLDNNKVVNRCSEEAKNENISDDYAIRAKYKLSYQGKGKFDISKLETILTYKQYIENC